MNKVVHIQSAKNIKKAEKMLQDLLTIERNMNVAIKTLEKHWAYVAVAEVLASLKNNIQLVQIQQKNCKQIIENRGSKK